MMHSMRVPLLILLLVGCGPGFRPENFPTPDALYEASVRASERGDCGDAIRGLERVVVQLPPRDPRLAEARYLLGVCQLDDGQRLEAARQFRRVATDFPEHQRAPWALLREGDAYAGLWKRPELDPTYGRSALSTYRELLGVYPGTVPADSARTRIQGLENKLALKEYKNGEFYLRHRAYDSAIIYFRSVVASWPESRWAAPALLKLAEIYREIGYREEAQETCQHLRRFYPEIDGLGERCPPDEVPAVSRRSP